MLQIDDLSVRYPGGVSALAGLSFTVPAGQFACVLGPSGCGKSTLLRCVAGLRPPSGGVVTVDGRPVAGPPPETAVVFQEYGRSLFPWKSVRDNVGLPLLARRVPRAARRRATAEALEAVGLGARGDAYPWQLSGGMQQRVAIARALVSRPRLLVMDEPFAAVDAQTREELEDLVLGLWRTLRMTVLFVTHDVDEAIYLGQRVLVLGSPPASLRVDLAVELPGVREQVTTRSLPTFSAYRANLHRALRDAHGPVEADRTGLGVRKVA